VRQDGETNLKIRKPLDLRGVPLANAADVMALRGRLSLELPSANLHQLRATFSYDAPTGPNGETEVRRSAVTMNEMLLRGCMLKNSRSVLGLVVYTGPESRIQMNAAKTPLKIGACTHMSGRLPGTEPSVCARDQGEGGGILPGLPNAT